MMKTVKLIHKETGKSENIGVNYVPTYLANGFVRADEFKPDIPAVIENDDKQPVKGKKEK